MGSDGMIDELSQARSATDTLYSSGGPRRVAPNNTPTRHHPQNVKEKGSV